MSSSENLITFIIPTRNRQECLLSLLHTFSRFFSEKCQKFDVVILDNSDIDTLSEHIKNYKFQIKYIYRSEQLSVVENFNQGTRYLTGKYACFMGDDDIISERIFDLAKLMANHTIDSAIISKKTKGIYFWPGINDAKWGDIGAHFFLGRSSGKIKRLNIDKTLKSASFKICDGPQSLPRAYSGIISRLCIEKVISKYGALFGGCSPDIYSSRLLASVVDSHIEIDLPILIAGASKTSTSAQRAERSDIGKLKENDHLGRFKDLKWNPCVPEFYSPFTVWAQSYLQAEELLGGKPNNEALAYLYAKCFLFARGNERAVLSSINLSSQKYLQKFKVIVKMISIVVNYGLEKFPLLYNRRPGGCNYEFKNINSSYDATICLEEQIKNIQIAIE